MLPTDVHVLTILTVGSCCQGKFLFLCAVPGSCCQESLCLASVASCFAEKKKMSTLAAKQSLDKSFNHGCEYCGRWCAPEPFPFPSCRYCGARPSYHHGRCCPMKPQPRTGVCVTGLILILLLFLVMMFSPDVISFLFPGIVTFVWVKLCRSMHQRRGAGCSLRHARMYLRQARNLADMTGKVSVSLCRIGSRMVMAPLVARISREGEIIDAVPMQLDVSDCGVAIHGKKLAKIALLCGVKWVAAQKPGWKQLVPCLRPLHCCAGRCAACQVANMTSESSILNVPFCAKIRGHPRSQVHLCADCFPYEESFASAQSSNPQEGEEKGQLEVR